MESKKINQLATELAPDLSDITIIGDPTTGISKKITLSQMASLFTGTVEEYANFAAFPLVGVADTIYIAKDTNVIYRWDSTAYVVLSPNIIASLVFNDANGFDGTIALVGSVATLTITTALTSGSVPFIGASGALSQDNANLFFDDTNNRLGINTNAPTTALDVFGSGIIGRINGTSTNNAYLGFASAGTNKWSIGNVQSDHRFRIFSEANTSELVSVLQTGEFGIGIANPTTKFHIDGAASALIANLDANVSVAKSLSFRSDNSNRINLEVSGTESGSNVGADFFIRRYSDAGALIDTPLTITRSTGNATFSGILITPQVKAATSAGLSINANSGTQVADFGAGGSANITFFGGLSGTSASFSSTTTASAFIPSGATIPTNGMYLSAANTLDFATNTTNRLTITSAGNVGIGTSSPNIGGYGGNGRVLTIQGVSGSYGVLELTSNSANADGSAIGRLDFGSDGQAANYKAISSIASFLSGSTSTKFGADLRFYTRADNAASGDPVERMRITSGGNVGIGTSSPAEKLHVEGIIRATSSTTGVNLHPNADFGAGSLPTIQVYTNHALQFATNNTLRMNISNGGKVMVNTTDSGVNALLYASASSSEPYPIGSKATTSSQGLMGFFDSANALQGSISISGATVSYNSFMGSHYSQFKNNDKPEVYKGTILEAIDELCNWEGETNDRLAKVKISDTIESKNVYGIFLDWDNSDEFNDMLVASLGASYIRVNENEIISMGDLLQSNGDGTAKVQSDDIMRSSTIAKVVSTNKIETYEDGSYLIAVTLHCG
jgi:hypothetical protein